MGAVVSCMEPEQARQLIENRAHGVKGLGANADSPLREPPAGSEKRLAEETSVAAEIISGCLEQALTALTEQEIDDSFPEAVLDATLQVLVPAWGPFHVRRALAEQWTLLGKGQAAVANVREPQRLLSPRKGRKEPEASAGARAESVHQSLPRRAASDRFVEAFIDGWHEPGTADGAWAVAMLVHERGGRQEIRDICGPAQDSTGRASALRAAFELFAAIGDGESQVRIETPAEFLVRGMSDGDSGERTRLQDEAEAWSSIERLCEAHRVEWRSATPGARRDLADRCDRMIRRALLAPRRD
jgi:hypothetical protein